MLHETHNVMFCKFQCAMTHNVAFFWLNHLNVSADQILEWSLSVGRLTGWELLTHQIAVNVYTPAGHSGDPASGVRTSLVVPLGTFLRSEHMLHREIGAVGIVGESQRILWH